MKPIVAMKKMAENEKKKGKQSQNKKFNALAEILINQKFYDKLLKAAVWKGKSILEDGMEEGRDRK